jgi:hypothetical protein
MKSEWQPIETAPQDGTSVLIWIVGAMPGGHADVAQFYNSSWWFSAQNPSSVVTHWMPLPEPPPIQHASSCAVHNEPAFPAGACDCGAR